MADSRAMESDYMDKIDEIWTYGSEYIKLELRTVETNTVKLHSWNMSIYASLSAVILFVLQINTRQKNEQIPVSVYT